MDDYASSDDDYRYSDQEDSVDDAFENDDHDYQLLGSKGPTTQVFSSFPFDFYSFTAVPNFIFFLFVWNGTVFGFCFCPLIYVCVFLCVFLFFYRCGLYCIDCYIREAHYYRERLGEGKEL